MHVSIYQTPSMPETAFIMVADIIKNAFLERAEQGIHFSCSSFTPEDIKSYYDESEGKYLLVSYDNDVPVGILMTQIRTKGKYKYMSHDYLATKAEYKDKGVASLLFREMLNLCKES